MFRIGCGAAALRARISIVGMLVMLLPQLLILAVGGRSVLNAELTVGALVALLGLSGLAVPPLSLMVGLLSTTLPTVLLSYRRVIEPLASLASVRESAAPLEAVDSLEVRDYAAGGLSPEQPFVRVPELVAWRGEIVCVRGSNASGKSTFLAALIGLLPASGRAGERTCAAERSSARCRRSTSPFRPPSRSCSRARRTSARGPVVLVTHDERLLAEADRIYETRRGPNHWELVEVALHRRVQTLSA